MSESKTPLVYILSNGRSGSTLLDILLGAHPNIWTIGESQRLPLEIKADTLCGCGVPITDCNFWQSIIPGIPMKETPYPIEYFRTNGGQGKVIHWKYLKGLLFGKKNNEQKRAIEIYGQINVEFFNAVWHAAMKQKGTDIRWLVDASKDPYRLFWLQQSGLFDIRVIHLLKSPPAFVYSMIKRNLPQTKFKAIRMTGRWIFENSLMRRLCTANFTKEQTLLLHYEKLASQTEETMSQIGKWLGLEFSPAVIKGFRDYENHAISGNQMRWQNSNIHLDENWRTQLPSLYIQAIRFATLPVSWLFDY